MKEKGRENNLLIHRYNVPKCCFRKAASIALTPARACTHVIEPNSVEKDSQIKIHTGKKESNWRL